MYERMLDKSVMPSEKEIISYVGEFNYKKILHLESILNERYDLKKELKFPFGNNYGWGYKYSHKTKHLFYLFFEKSSFTITIQISKKEDFEKISDELLAKTKELWKKRYPCGEDGGWMHYRIESDAEIDDILKLIAIKKKPVSH